MESLKVLLVDDEVEFLTALVERLQLRGIHASMATDGEEALRRIETDHPDVVVLDVLLPGLGGLEVLERIKRTHPEVRVILLTGGASHTEGAEGMRLGAFDYMTKPLKIEELIQKMREALEKSPPGAGDAGR